MAVEMGAMLTPEEVAALAININDEGVGEDEETVSEEEVAAEVIPEEEVAAEVIPEEEVVVDDKVEDITTDAAAEPVDNITVTSPEIPFMQEPTAIDVEDTAEAVNELAESYEAGDLTLAEYTTKTSALQAKNIMAEQSVKALAAHHDNVWAVEKNAFFKANPMFDATNVTLHAALSGQYDAIVKSDEAITGLAALVKAAENVVTDLGLKKEQAPVEKVKPQKSKPAKTLDDVPTAKPGETKGEFDDVDGLDGAALEAAIAKMTPAERSAYMAA